jgi:hypothetical protein
MKRDEVTTGWVRNNSTPFQKPDLNTNRNQQPVDVQWCRGCNLPQSLCRCER